jgi:CheY-like chemotaxis protein
MPSRKILVVDDKKEYPSVDDPYIDLVDYRDSLEDPELVSWSSYAAVFSHTPNKGNKAADWADDQFEAGKIDGLFVFSGGEDTVSEYLGVYTLPRSLYYRRFSAFVKQYAEGKPVEECAEVFLASSFDDEQSASPEQIDSSSGTDSTRSVALIQPDDEKPAWCSTAFPIQTQDRGKGPKLSVEPTLNQLNDLDEPHAIVLQDTYLNDGDGLNLLLHLRLDAENTYSRYPVCVQLSQSLEAWIRRDPHFALLATDEVHPVPSGESIEEHLPSSLEALDLETHLRILSDLPLSPKSSKGRHDLANEWGPIRLWDGLRRLSSSEIPPPKWVRQSFLRLTQRRYYKYLFALSTLRRATGLKEQDSSTWQGVKERYKDWQDFLDTREAPIRLGLIEDEADKGWADALDGLFADAPDAGTVEVPYEAPAFNDLDVLAKNIEQRNWDGLLVDLRLTESDQEASSRHADQLSGVQLIRALKQSQPDLPIIAVTASNKAWTAKKLQEVGADGYWIKESPEYGVRLEYTVQNAADLVGTLHKAIQRYDEARPLWRLVKRLRALQDDEETVFTFVPLTGEKDPSRVRERFTAIEKRLRRAFGYMVMDSSAHEEDAFAINRLDLAFLTTWSVLNEVASLYFSDPRYRGKDLSETSREHNFRFMDPENQSVETYWQIENGEVTYDAVPMPSSLENLLRPTKNGAPTWPGRNKDNPRIQWLLHRAGAPDLACRMHDDNFTANHYDVNSNERPPLRNLRNHLEESHGEISQVWHAELQDVYDLLDIWNTILPV